MAEITVDYGDVVQESSNVLSVSDAIVETAGTYQPCGFRPTKIYVTVDYGATVVFYVYDEETGIDLFKFRNSGSGYVPTTATTYITIDDNGFTLKPYNSSYQSTSSSGSTKCTYNYVAIG